MNVADPTSVHSAAPVATPIAKSALTPDHSRRSRVLITPEGIALPIVVGSRGARLGALIIDLVIIFAVLLAFALLLDAIAGGVRDAVVEDDSTAGAWEFVNIISIIFSFFFWYGYFLLQELGPRGATLGKRMLGIRVAARGGGRLTPEAIIARNLLRDVEIFFPIVFLLVALIMSFAVEINSATLWTATIWFLVFALFPFCNRDALRAGDIVAGTWVVEAPRTKLADALSTQGAASTTGASDVTGARYQFGPAELSIYGEHELQTLERMLRDDNAEALEAVHQTICRKIGWDPGAGDERAFLEAFYAQLRARLENDMRFGKRKADKHS